MKKILVICRNVSTYHAPIFKELAKKSDLNVLYLEKDGFKNKFNKEYNTWIKAEKFLFKGYNFTFLNHNKSYFRYIIFFFILLDILKKKKIENVLIFGYDSIYNWIALFISKISKKKYIMER